MIELKSEEDLNTLLQNSTITLVDFWAPWCGPCKALAPIFEELASGWAQTYVGFAKANCDEVRDLAVKYGVRSIPTVIIFDNGQPVVTLTGLKTKAELVAAVEQVAVGVDFLLLPSSGTELSS